MLYVQTMTVSRYDLRSVKRRKHRQQTNEKQLPMAMNPYFKQKYPIFSHLKHYEQILSATKQFKDNKKSHRNVVQIFTLYDMYAFEYNKSFRLK